MFVQQDCGQPAFKTAATEADIECALAAPWYVLDFPPLLEARYWEDGKADRVRYQKRVGLLGLLLFMSFLPTDAELIPDMFHTAVILRLSTLGTGILTMWALRPTMPDWSANSVMAFLSVGPTAIVILLFVGTRSADKAAYLNGLATITLFGNVCLQQRFWWVVGCSAATAAIVLAGLLTGGISLPVLHSEIGLLISSQVLTLAISNRLEYQRRRSYLFAEREALRKIELQHSNARLLDLSERDALTGLANRRAVDQRLAEAWAECAAAKWPIAVIMVDVDWFKKFNDTYGHPAGDECLRRVANALHQQVRTGIDLAGRYGGEEFILILPGADPDGAERVAARACAAVSAMRIPHEAAPGSGFVSASLGLACAQPAHGGHASALVTAADGALYVAKQAGRARVSRAEPAF